MRISRLFIAISFALAPAILEAQDISIGNDNKQPIEERILYNRESTWHGTLHSRGWGFGYKSGKIRSIYKTTNWNYEFSYMRSQKQIKLVSLYTVSPYVFGKLNDMLLFKTGYEVERRIFGKPYWGGVELRWLYEAGVSLALLKPYYYTVLTTTTTSLGEDIQTVEYLPFDEDMQWDIIGKAPFRYGFSGLKVRPGIYAKGGLCFETGSKRAKARSIEVGGAVEYYPQGVNLMYSNPTEYVFLTLYLSYNFGSRFNRY